MRVLNSKDKNNITKLWLQSHPDNLLAIIGGKIIKIYLEFFFNNNDNIGFAYIKNKKIISFVLYGNDGEINARIIKNYFLIIIISFFKNVLFLRFIKALSFLDVFLFLVMSLNFKYHKNFNRELLIICTKKKFQGKGIGSKLLKSSIQHKYFKKYSEIYVKTMINEKSNINFYKKNSFFPNKIIFRRVFLKLIIN